MLPPSPAGLAALFLDVDGTLLDLAATPDGVAVPDSLRHALATLDKQLEGAVALVSGRTIADLDGLFKPVRLRASGVHGAELRFDPNDPVHISDEHSLPVTMVSALRDIAGRYPGTLVEDKRFSVAIHYRAVPDSGPALRRDLDEAVESDIGQGCRILPGHMVFEVKRTGFDKGTAIATLLQNPPFQGRQPIFIGDDVTDLPGFARVLAAGGLAYSVTTIRPGLSGHFPNPESVRTWLVQAATLAA